MRKFTITIPILILISVILLLNSTIVAAQLPKINKPLEETLFKGNIEEITSAVKRRQKLIQAIITEIDQKKDELTSSSNTQHSFTSIKDLYRGISLQYKGLLAELPRQSPAILKRPQVKGPPFNLEEFDKILGYQKRINIVLTETNRRYTLTQSRLIHLKQASVDELSEYSRLLNTNSDKTLLLYEKCGKLLSIQCEYALLYSRKPKIESQLKKLNKENEASEKWIEKAFTSLTVNQADIKKAKQAYNHEVTTLEQITNSSSAEYQDLNRRLLLYENRFDKAADKSRTQKSSSSVQKQENLQIEIERIELIRSALTLRIHLIEQKRLSEKIELHRSKFRLQWLENYIDKSRTEPLADFIKNWSQQSSECERKLEALIRSTSEVTLARSNLIQKLVNINSLRTSVKPGAQYQALISLTRQAEKTNENIDKLIIELSRNSLAIQSLKFEIDRILRLCKSVTSKGERIRLRGQLYLSEVTQSAQNILYYPILTIGTWTVTMAVIFKIIFLFLLGIFSLRLLRRKANIFLEKKAGMSTGSINSITTLGYYIGLIICSIVVLSAAGLDLSQLSIVLGALGVGIGFGLQTISNNFFSGIILLSEQTVKIGDYVNLKDGVIGKVKKMSIRTTIIRNFDGVDTVVPNSDLIANRVETWTYGDDWRRLKIPFGVAYGSDPDQIVQLATAAAREVDITMEDFMHPLRVFFEGFGDNSLDFSIRPWCRISFLQTGSGITSEYYFALFRKLKEAGISIPFPQRDLHLSSLSAEIIEQLKGLREENRVDHSTGTSS